MERPAANAPTLEILITLPIPEEILAPLREISSRLNITVQAARRPEDVPAEVWSRVEVLYTDRVLPAPELVPNLRWLQFHSAGIDFALESPLLKKPGLMVTTLSGAAAPQAAEYTLGLLLALSHHVPAVVGLQARAEWPRERWERLTPRELRGATLGIVGYGSIGREVARLVRPLEMEVLAAKYDAMHPDDFGYFAEGIGDPRGDLFTRLYPFQALRSMIKSCDFVVVATPLTPDTRNLIGAPELAAMKPTAYLVVVGRGGVVDETALLEALQEKRLAGAALDVFQEEPLSPTSPLWRQPNLLISPHLSGLSTHYDERAVTLFGENLKRYLGGAALFNRYNPERGY
jgi:phosphoglycerate dehydrogenase-like enzyme